MTQTGWEDRKPALEDTCMQVLTVEVGCVLIVGRHTYAAVEEDDSFHILGPAEANKQYFDIDSLPHYSRVEFLCLHENPSSTFVGVTFAAVRRRYCELYAGDWL